ncbi:hypothetical protein NPIL_169881 [Nephila pilipes]|uniref:Uncharacterized protein n=1 Tax=Nephila pilipes TaxID=299642 RepID=A0A8X6MF94_NEPPI|nr:hypothetical protein NPIL_169881 [Nephila pilipes]
MSKRPIRRNPALSLRPLPTAINVGSHRNFGRKVGKKKEIVLVATHVWRNTTGWPMQFEVALSGESIVGENCGNCVFGL